MYYKIDDLNLYYEVYGKNNQKEILILPGWGDTRETFKKLINYLKNYYKVYIIDYPGFGKTIFPNRDLNIYDYANIIRSFLKNNNIQNPNIIAHSFGGRIAIILNGIYNIKIEKLILIDIAGIRRKSIKRLYKTFVYKLRKKLVIFKNKKNKITYLQKLRRKYSSTDYNNLNKNMYITFKNIINENLKKYIKKISCQTFIIWGKKDIDTPIKDGYYLRNRIKKSKILIYDNGSHFVYLEYDDINEKILNFLNKNNNE